MQLCRTYAEFVIVLQIFCLKFQITAGHEDGEQHEKSTDKRHLLGHLGDWLDLDGQALRHIEDHLQTMIDSDDDIKDIANGDNPKGLFYFFKIHDYDNNHKLDGLEWFKALTDFHDVSQKNGGQEYDDTEVETMIDDLLKKHDLDHDGYISFTEMINDKPDSLFNELDKMDEAENHNPSNTEDLQNENDSQDHGQDQQNTDTENQVDGQTQQNEESDTQNEGQNQQNDESENQNDGQNQQNEENQEAEIRIIDSQENQNERVIDSQEF